MKIIAGLGNPGKKYESSRHNAGFKFVDKMSEYLGWDTFYEVGDWHSDKDSPFVERCARSGGKLRVLFIKPMTFMNLSGSGVRRAIETYKIMPSDDLILVHDDLDIELGKFKIQRAVSPKNHNGVRSVEMAIEKTDFLRVRLGVDSRGGNRSVPPEEYVLQKMTEDELHLLDETIDEAVKQLRSLVQF